MPKTILITGASSGIGAACAQYLAERGHTVYGTSRTAPAPAQAQRQKVGSGALTLFQMDVDDDASVQAGVAFVLQQVPQLEVVVNNAGFGLAGAIETTSVAEAKAQFETNFFGVQRVVQAVLPHLRYQRAGYILNISSIGGLIAIPFQGFYSASKFALEGYTEALRMEVRPFGIRVVLIEPGDFHTAFTTHRRRVAGAATDTAYQATLNRALAVMERDEQQGPAPVLVARLIERILSQANPAPRHLVGPAYESVAVWLKAVLPAPWFEWLLMKYYQLH